MTSVSFLDPKNSYLEIQEEIDEAVQRVVSSGWYILGEEVEAFEGEYAEYCGVKYCLGVGNGLNALHLILRALEIGPGDDVLVPSHTFIATWLAVTYEGATPVPVEPPDDTTYTYLRGGLRKPLQPEPKQLFPSIFTDDLLIWIPSTVLLRSIIFS